MYVVIGKSYADGPDWSFTSDQSTEKTTNDQKQKVLFTVETSTLKLDFRCR